jgi:hypothetical protein
MTLLEQFANIGSEVERALSWTERHHDGLAASALDRSLQLIDLTIADPRRRTSGTLKELTRIREILCDFLLGGNQYNTSAAFLRSYFYAFAAAARKPRES